MSYVLITFAVLLFLNIYCSKATQDLFSQSKKDAVIEKCLMASDEISQLEVLNRESIRNTLHAMTSLKYTRILVTDSTGNTVYDSVDRAESQYVLLPEIVDALFVRIMGNQKVTMKTYGMDENRADEFATFIFNNYQGDMSNYPRVPTLDELKQIIQECL